MIICILFVVFGGGYLVKDYRNNPEDSPLAWCPYRKQLIKVTRSMQVMKTVFYVHPTGIYPYVKAEAMAKKAIS